MSLPTGYYAFEWSGGTFEVQLRPGGEFWCPRFAAPATWQFSGGTLAIDWGKYGEYVLRLSGDALAGGARGNESDWRKMRFLRAFTPQEALVSASVWRLRSGDEEPLLVQFRADGRFVCPSRAGTFSYRLEGDSVLIEWDSLSNDRLQLDMAAKAMAGSTLCCPLCAASSAVRLEYVERLAAYVPPETCKKGCCLADDPDAACKAGRKRGSRLDRGFDEAPAKAKLSWGMDVPECCTTGARASGASGGGGSSRD